LPGGEGGGGSIFWKTQDTALYSTYIESSLPQSPFTEAVDMNGRFQMQGGKNWILPKEMNANRFFWDSHWLKIWSNHLFSSMGLNGGSVAVDSGQFLDEDILLWCIYS
jgi:hypothetical protein